jgi:type I restriction enzyme S subunit
MSDSWPAKPVGPRITELGKSMLPAGLADDQGAFPFYCSSPQVRRIDRAIMTTPAVLMGTGGAATVHLGQGAFSYSTDTWAFTASDPWTDLAFLYRQLEHRLPQIDYAGFGGSGLRHLDKGYIRRLSLPVPSLEEQALIARMLSAIDIAIRETEAIIAKLKAVKQGLLHDLLTRGIDANGELRPTQAEAPHLYKQSPLGWIPSDWRVQPLAAYTASDITYGIVQAGPHIPGGVPYIRTGDMAGDALVRESMLCTSRRIAGSYARSEVRAGEIVMAIRATVGKVLPVPSDLDGANLTQGTARISPNARTDRTFLLWAIRHSRAQKSIQLEVKGTTFAEITLGALRQVPLAAPIEMAEQAEIGKRLTAVDEQLIHERVSLAKRRSEKAGLMDDLLTGRVRVAPLLAEAERPKESA